MGPAWAVNQAPLVTKSQSLQEYEIVICGAPDSTQPICLFAEQSLKQMGATDRVVLRQAPSGGWVRILYDEFVENRRRFIGMLASLTSSSIFT